MRSREATPASLSPSLFRVGPRSKKLAGRTGMRLAEALRLRVKDVNFSYDQITVRDGKRAPGGADGPMDLL